MTERYPHWVANQSWLMFGFPQPQATSTAPQNGRQVGRPGLPAKKIRYNVPSVSRDSYFLLFLLFLRFGGTPPTPRYIGIKTLAREDWQSIRS